MKRKAFIKPIAAYLAGLIDWNNTTLIPVKNLVRVLLRAEQEETCPYCQRLIIPERRNMTEHIEHYLDKSHEEYRKFGLTATNLVLACPGCNIEKGTRDLVVDGKAKPLHLSIAEAPFRWPHPYFDDMTAFVRRDPGSVYSIVPGSGREAEAQQMITDLKLDTIEHAESRHGRLVAEQSWLLQEIKALLKLNTHASREQMPPLIARLERVNRELN